MSPVGPTAPDPRDLLVPRAPVPATAVDSLVLLPVPVASPDEPVVVGRSFVVEPDSVAALPPVLAASVSALSGLQAASDPNSATTPQ